jgi:predicted O-linked N-acetylglucosamine transferase (SPINDLY family)/glycosyltransferase involved in cell wall biosynthesis
MDGLKKTFDNILRLLGECSNADITARISSSFQKIETLTIFQNGFAQHAFERGKLQDALKVIDLLEKVHPLNFILLLTKGEIFEFLGKTIEAASFYDAAQSLIPGHGIPFTKKLLLGLRDIRAILPQSNADQRVDPFICMSSLGSNGRFGNQLFQYTFLRCYAMRHNLRLEVPDWLGRHVFGFADDWCSDAPNPTPATVQSLIANSGDTALRNCNVSGYFNEHTGPLFEFKDFIQNLFRPSTRFAPALQRLKHELKLDGAELIGLHLRRGDFGYGEFWIAPEAWYIDWVAEKLQKNPQARLYIATDDRAALEAFARFRPITCADLRLGLGELDFLLDFYALAYSDFLAISNSTFSFFAAMLNRGGREFVRPIPDQSCLKSFDPWNSEVLIKHSAEELKKLSASRGGHEDEAVMRPYVFFLSSRSNYRDSIVSPIEIFCGPDARDEFVGGSYRCVKTPAQPFDAPKFLVEKGVVGVPNLILVKADATGRNFPRSLGAFKCPKVLLVGDTHHMQAPIRKLIEYAKSEPFDWIILDHTRHHARWFFEAGLKNVYWIPALDFTFQRREIAARPSRKLSFVGQAGRFHPYRCHVLEELKRAGVPLEVMQTSPSGAADVYADSQITLNIALNGDLNLRVFEALAAGGFLLTDRLGKSSGLEGLFTPGEDLEVWSSKDELVEKIQYYLSNPAEAFRIRRTGQKKLLDLHSPEVKIREFWDLVLHGKENPAYSLESERGAIPRISAKPVMELLPAYEFFQELHRNRSRLVFYCSTEEIENIRRFVNLPRVECKLHEEWGDVEKTDDVEFPEERILHMGDGFDVADLDGLMTKSQPKFIFAPAGKWDLFMNWGFTQKEVGLFELTRPVLGIVRRARNLESEAARPLLSACVEICINDAEALEVADACDVLGLVELRRNALLRAVFLNRDCFSALVQLADLSLEAEAPVDAALLLSEANRVEELPKSIAPVFCELMEKLSEAPPILEYNQALAGGDHPLPAVTQKILVVTNLFPPQELGGYGRQLWEFTAGLAARGHEVLILTSDSPYLDKPADESEMVLEGRVRRVLGLIGQWRDGGTFLVGGPAEQARIIYNNAAVVLKTTVEFRPDFVLLGNLDFMGVALVQKLIERGIPVIHSLANQTPGYTQKECFRSALYTLAACSNWLGQNFIKQGFSVPRMETVYPGAKIDRFYRYFLPDCRRLRIAYASLMMPYKGPQLLVHALIQLHNAGVDFDAEIAGDTTDQTFVDSLAKVVAQCGLSKKVKFIGYQGRRGVADLFARSNVLAFPSEFEEPFGITQVEAMASGLIVVTSGRGGTREIVQHGINGLVFEAGNPDSLAQNLLLIAKDEEMRLRLQRKARERAIELSVTASVKRLELIAESMLGRNSVSATKNDIVKQVTEGKKEPKTPTPNLVSPNATISDAQIAFNAGNLSNAEDICREILGKDERFAGAWHLMGKMAALQGDLEVAGEFASVACELDSQNPEFVCEWAEVFLRKKELESAEQQVRRALEMAPESPGGLVLLGRILAEKDDKSASLEAFQDALRLRKDYAEGFSHYATALQKFGRGKDAISQIRKACALEPNSVEFQTNLAILLEQNARYVDALAAYGKAARMNPNVGFVWFRQGKLLNGLKRYAESIPALAKAISLPGQLGDYHYEYGLALHMSKRFQEALVHYEKALSMGYNTAALQCNRGVIYKDLRKGGDAIMAFHAAVKMDPSNVSYLNNLGAAALELGLNTEALECFEQAVEKNPKLPTARNNIGNLLKDRARGMDALPQYRKSMELNPDDRDAPSNYLLCHMYIPDMDPKLVFEEHKKWGISTTKKFPPAFKFKPREAGAKIRVGFLSADLCHHPVAHFIEPIFRCYDRERFEVVAYGDQRKSDEFSARFAKQVDLWRETSSYDDRALAKLIHEDRVDILFELAGHTAYNRLGVFALKPASVQVSYLGYPGTTGLPTIDFRITDAFADPQGTTEHLHTEKLIRVPECAWCFEPDASAPEVEPLPALKNGYVTFGCFNNMAKLNPSLFETWAEILLRVPGSHLRLKARTLTDDGVRKELKSYFTERGIEEDRLDFFGHTKKIADHLNHYHSVDIALDSFPYHGTTTTCEAMWMGCPVVTRAGKTHVSRVGVSLLNAVGLQEFITDTREAYIEKAVALAAQTDRLQELRSGMRERLKKSVLMDEKRFVTGFETALMEMATLGGLTRP